MTTLDDFFAQSVAGRRLALAEAEAAYSAALAEVSKLDQRIKAVEGRRAIITGRRLEGKIDAAEAAEFAALQGDAEALRESLLNTAASLAAAISLLERGSKKAAPSDKMFDMMLSDYRKTLASARTTLNRK